MLLEPKRRRILRVVLWDYVAQADPSNLCGLHGAAGPRKCWVLRRVDVLYLWVQVKSDRVPTQIVIKGKTIGKA